MQRGWPVHVLVARKPAALTRKESLMNRKETNSQKKLRLRKTTLREVSSDLAQNVMGGSVPFTKTCTYLTCGLSCNTICD